MMIAKLDRSNEIVAKYLSEYEQAEAGLLHDEKENMQDFVPMNSKLESERLKRPRIQLGKERFKKLKTAKASGIEPTQEQQSKELKELYEEELKKMIELVTVEELYIEALQKFDREDMDRLWSLVKETCNKTEATDEKEKEL
nr:hypothetical protein [Tanacetum cinerariifolium]